MRTPLSNIQALNALNGPTDEVAIAKISVTMEGGCHRSDNAGVQQIALGGARFSDEELWTLHVR